MRHPRFLADNDLNDHVVDGVLRRESHVEFVKARDVGLYGRDDTEVLEYGAANGLVVVSHDVNTMPAHAYARIAEGAQCSGLLMVHQRDPVGAVIDSLVLIWSASQAEEWRNVVAFLPL